MTVPKAADHYFRGICGVHVTKISFNIGLFGSIFEFLSLLYLLVVSFFGQPAPWYHGLLDVFSLITYLTLMMAVKQEKSALFWPYLIGNTLFLFLDMVLIIALLTYRSDIINHRRSEMAEKKEREVVWLSLVYAVFVTISAFSNIYCIWVAWRAKKYFDEPGIQASVYHLRGSRPYNPDLFGPNLECNQRLIV